MIPSSEQFKKQTDGLIEQWIAKKNYTEISNKNNLVRFVYPVPFSNTPSVVFAPNFSAENSNDWYPNIESLDSSKCVINTRKVNALGTEMNIIALGY